MSKTKALNHKLRSRLARYDAEITKLIIHHKLKLADLRSETIQRVATQRIITNEILIHERIIESLESIILEREVS